MLLKAKNPMQPTPQQSWAQPSMCTQLSPRMPRVTSGETDSLLHVNPGGARPNCPTTQGILKGMYSYVYIAPALHWLRHCTAAQDAGHQMEVSKTACAVTKLPGLGTCKVEAASMIHQLNPGELSCFTIHTESHVVCLEIAVGATLGMWP